MEKNGRGAKNLHSWGILISAAGSSPLSRVISEFLMELILFEGWSSNGVVLYYHLRKKPQIPPRINLEIPWCWPVNLVRRLRLRKDSEFKSYPGGPSAEPTLR